MASRKACMEDYGDVLLQGLRELTERVGELTQRQLRFEEIVHAGLTANPPNAFTEPAIASRGDLQGSSQLLMLPVSDNGNCRTTAQESSCLTFPPPPFWPPTLASAIPAISPATAQVARSLAGSVSAEGGGGDRGGGAQRAAAAVGNTRATRGRRLPPPDPCPRKVGKVRRIREHRCLEHDGEGSIRTRWSSCPPAFQSSSEYEEPVLLW